MRQNSEKGFALVLSLVLLLVMSLMGGTLIVVASGITETIIQVMSTNKLLCCRDRFNRR